MFAHIMFPLPGDPFFYLLPDNLSKTKMRAEQADF
jgi:hypothetical protein